LKTIKQKHDESLQDYVKHSCNTRNAISYIQDIEIINAFHDGVSDIKTVAHMLIVADVCIEASKAWAQLLESHGKGPSKKKEDLEANTTDRVDRKDLGYRGK
jgi:ethanolamine utilization protein EutA (predicted chaperonin)